MGEEGEVVWEKNKVGGGEERCGKRKGGGGRGKRKGRGEGGGEQGGKMNRKMRWRK